MYQAVLNVPDLSLVLRLKQLGAENYNVRCCFTKNSKELGGTAPRKVTSSKRQPLTEKNEKSEQSVKPAQPEKSQQIYLGYNFRTLTHVEVMRLAGDDPKVIGDLTNFWAKEEHKVFFIGEMPFGLQLDADKTEKKARGKVLFLCFKCGKILHNSSSMQAHAYSHIGVKQFPCSFCDKGYSYKSGLNRHCRKLHRLNVPPTTPKKPKLQNSIAQHYTCPICQQGYESKNGFYKHWRMNHKNSGRPQPIITRGDGTSPASVPQIVEAPATADATCLECFKTYSTKKLLKCHFNRVHSSIHNFVCLYCLKGFYYKASYDYHMKKEIKNQRIENTDKENIAPFEEFLRYING